MSRRLSGNIRNVGWRESTIVLLNMSNGYHILFNTVQVYQLRMYVLSYLTRAKAIGFLVWYPNAGADLAKIGDLQMSF